MKIPEILVVESERKPGSLAKILQVMGFRDLLKGALDAGAERITDNTLFAAAEVLANMAKGHDLVPDPLDISVHQRVADVVIETADRDGNRK